MPNPAVKSKLAGLKIKPQPTKPAGPVWAGPDGKGPNGGITFSLLSRYLSCPERFRVRVVEGLRPADQFNHRIEYGNMWHVCEEAFARGDFTGHLTDDWVAPLEDYARELMKKYPLQQADIEKWYGVCCVQFPVYVDYWSRNPDVIDRTPLLQEEPFDVPYKLPSGRTVRLRGKFDSVDLIDGGVYLQENKTKGDIDETQLRRQLTFDMQTMMYLVALKEMQHEEVFDHEVLKPFKEGVSLLGVRYNVVRRPLSGGEGNIVQRKPTKGSKCPKCKESGLIDGENCPKCGGAGRVNPKPGETTDEYLDRLRGVIDGTGLNSDGEHYTGPSFWFMRWKIEVTPNDVKEFRRQCLDPILEQLLDWWSGVAPDAPRQHVPIDYRTPLNYRRPFGIVNSVDEYGYGDIDEYLNTGSEAGLRRVDDLFPELKV